jgi:LPPG:FO 2-phospho-L-lactate transferase
VFETEVGELGFQEHVVLHRGAPRILGVRLAGIDTAGPAPGVLELLSGAETILIAPSNPITSIGPILAVPGVAELLAKRRDRVVAVSPVVAGRAPVTPPEQGRALLREAVLAAEGLPHSPVSAAVLWKDVAAGFVLDSSDQALEAEIRALGLETLVVDTLERTPAGRRRLAEAVLAFARRLAIEAGHA